MSGHPGFGAHTDPSFKSQPRSTGEVVRRVGVYLRPYKLMAVGTVTFALLSLAAAFTYPKLTQHVIDEVITKKNAASLTPAMLALLGAFLLRELFNGLRIRVGSVVTSCP